MEQFYQILSVLLMLSLIASCGIVVLQVRKSTKQLARFEKIISSMNDSTTKARFMASSTKDKIALMETTMSDLQSQVDVLMSGGNMEVPKTEEKPDDAR